MNNRWVQEFRLCKHNQNVPGYSGDSGDRADPRVATDAGPAGQMQHLANIINIIVVMASGMADGIAQQRITQYLCLCGEWGKRRGHHVVIPVRHKRNSKSFQELVSPVSEH